MTIETGISQLRADLDAALLAWAATQPGLAVSATLRRDVCGWAQVYATVAPLASEAPLTPSIHQLLPLAAISLTVTSPAYGFQPVLQPGDACWLIRPQKLPLKHLQPRRGDDTITAAIDWLSVYQLGRFGVCFDPATGSAVAAQIKARLGLL